MGTFLERLVQEQKELNEKLTKLRDFIGTENFLKLKEADQLLLKMQYKYMDQYNDILCIRIGTIN